MNQISPQAPFFPQIPRHFRTEEELEAIIDVVTITIYGTYAFRGKDRKEVLQGNYRGEVDVPADYHVGHVKLAANRYVRNELHGIRVKEFHVDYKIQPKPCEHKRRVRDFISEKGMRDNDRAKRAYYKELDAQKAQMEQMQQGIAPSFVDNTQYRADGLPPISEKVYLA